MTTPLHTNDIAGLITLQSISTATQFNAWMYATIKPYIKGRVLELGSGIGNITDHLTTDFTPVVLSDYNPDYCTYLKNKFHKNENVEAVLNIDLQDPQFFQHYQHLQHSFDAIVLLNVIEHLGDDAKCVSNCRFLLQRGGHFIVLAPAYQILYSALDKEIGHFRRYTTGKLAGLLNASGFDILHKQYFNATGIGGWLVMNKLLGRKTISTTSMKNFDRLVPFSKVLDKAIGNRFGLSAIVVGKKTF